MFPPRHKQSNVRFAYTVYTLLVYGLQDTFTALDGYHWITVLEIGRYLWAKGIFGFGHLLKKTHFVPIEPRQREKTRESIGRRFAANYFLTPQAIANDGLLDVCLIKELKFLERFKIFTMVPSGSHLSHPQVHYFRTDAIDLKFDQKVPHHMDGEMFFAAHFNIRICPKALNIIYNPRGAHYFQ